MNPILSFVILLIGLYGLATSKKIIKSIICINIVQTGAILLFLNYGQLNGNKIPILSNGTEGMVDPLPQALMITAIIIGSTITALALMISIKIFHHYGTLNWNDVFKGEE